jgi:hypothetical protein
LNNCVADNEFEYRQAAPLQHWYIFFYYAPERAVMKIKAPKSPFIVTLLAATTTLAIAMEDILSGSEIRV